MISGFLMRWISRWLDRHGIGNVADSIDKIGLEAGDVTAIHDLARRALSRGEVSVAIGQLEKATSIESDDASLWCSLGAAYRHAGSFDEARRAYERALALKAEYPQVLSNLGEWCLAQGQYEEALTWLERALIYAPLFFEARVNKTAALFELARFDESLVLAKQLVIDEPHRAEAYLNLGNVLVHTGKSKQGLKQYQKALELQPGYPEAHFNLATLLGSREDLANTISYLERRLKDRGDSVQNLGILAAAHQAAGHFSKSEELCHRILVRQPDNINALITLGSCLSNGGDSAAAVALYERVLKIDPTQSAMASNIVFELNNLAGPGREEVFRRHKEWAEKFEAPLQGSVDYAGRDLNPERKLRIGYVSGDFTKHPVGFLLRSILRQHDKSKFSVHCFSMVIRPEDVLPELREAADTWEDIFFLGDEEVAELIAKAEVDILVDLSGHTAFHRLAVFARRPAPVQVEWVGYFHSTGMKSIDYFITDPRTSPSDNGQLFTEIPVTLPNTRFCYGPPEYAPDVSSLPWQRRGAVTFGSFNRLPKVTESVVAAWSQIIKAVPNSVLIIKSSALSDPSVRARLLARFDKYGIGPDSLELREGSVHAEMLAEYGDIDIALDTFPFNGGMTTLEALWMGVPVATIAGNTVVSRQTVSALANIGLADELAFPDVDAYVEGAIALANKPARLTELRAQIRPRMAASPLCQSEQFTHDLEALFRRMWEAWCRGEKLES